LFGWKENEAVFFVFGLLLYGLLSLVFIAVAAAVVTWVVKRVWYGKREPPTQRGA
jgi:hypothetical protein